MAATALSAGAPPVDILGILSGLGLTRQGEMAIASSVLLNAWTAIMTGRIMPMVAPVVLKYFVVPFTNTIKSVAKAFIFLGIVGWLFASMIPIILTSIGIAGAGSFVGRALNSPSFSYAPVVNRVGNLTSRGLEYFELDSEVCRQMISCKAGEFVVDNYPALVMAMDRVGVLNRLDRYSKQGSNRYVVETVSSMAGKRNGTCEETLDPCAGLESLEAFFDPSKRRIVNESESTTLPPTTTHAPDTIVGFISKIAADAMRGR